MPTGTVSAYMEGVLVTTCGVGGYVSLNGSGEASCSATVANTAGGSATLSASYSGDVNYNPVVQSDAMGELVTFNVGHATATVTASARSSAVGVPVTYTATVTGGGDTPTGTVIFYDNGTAITTCGTSGVVTLVAGVTTCAVTYASTTGSPHTISASYSGDANYASVAQTNSVTTTETVTTVTVTASAGSSAVGVPVTYTATVTGAGTTPTGTVIFYDNGTAITTCGTGGVVTLVAGAATCAVTYASTTASPHTISASYSGDTNYASVAQTNSVVTTETVTTASVSVAVTHSPPSPTVGNTVIFIATVTGAGTNPTGAVSASNWTISGSAGLVTCSSFAGPTASDGHVAVYTCTTAAASGSGTVSAAFTYPGDTNYGALSSATDSVDIGVTSTGTGTTSLTQSITWLSVPLAAVRVGDTFTLEASAPGGVVIFAVDPTSAGCTVSGSLVTFTVTGTCIVDATAPGNDVYLAGSSSVSIVVGNLAAQSITFTSQPPVIATVGLTYSVVATAPGGVVSFGLDTSSSGCTLSGNLVTFTGLGTCVIDANVPANASYQSAKSSQSISVTTIPTTIVAPTNVTAVAGDGQVLVVWSAPFNASSYSAVSYTVSSRTSGVSCVSTSTSCLVTGLTNGKSYVFAVAATSTGPVTSSPTSTATSAVTPSVVAISVGTSGGTTELNPGSGTVTLSDGSTSSVSVSIRGQSVVVTNGTVSMTITASGITGTGSSSTVVVMSGGTAVFSGSGFLPGSTVDIYIYSTSTFIGAVRVRQDGTYQATFPIPSSLTAGHHTIQSQGFAASGERLAVRVGVVVVKAPKVTLVISRFADGSTILSSAMMTSIAKLAQTIKVKGATSAIITGYTDGAGATALNLAVGRSRALAASKFLLAQLKTRGYTKGLSVSVVTKGASSPVASNATAAGRAANRRVVMVVTLK
jgi:outer membrane protein OmpA-like peptidoglycan-associated protein